LWSIIPEFSAYAYPAKEASHAGEHCSQTWVFNSGGRTANLHTKTNFTSNSTASPLLSIVIPQDKIETELTPIFKAVSHNHALSAIDRKKVKASQREKLRRFYKRPLPHHETAENIGLVILGLRLDKQAMTREGENLRSIVEGDIGRYTEHHVVAMVASSGSGKTATVINLASKYFLIYAVCCIPSPTANFGQTRSTTSRTITVYIPTMIDTDGIGASMHLFRWKWITIRPNETSATRERADWQRQGKSAFTYVLTARHPVNLNQGTHHSNEYSQLLCFPRTSGLD
jgi:hypothetical protein